MLFAVVSAMSGALGVIAPGSFLHAIWPTREAAGAELFVRGWGACLLALSAMAWTNRNAQDPFVYRSIALALFVYFSVAAAVWFADARAIGWTVLSAVTFACLAGFASMFGYFRLFTLSTIRRTI